MVSRVNLVLFDDLTYCWLCFANNVVESSFENGLF
jgi:hypothetical protein